MKIRDILDSAGQWVMDNPSKALILLAIIGAFTLGWILG